MRGPEEPSLVFTVNQITGVRADLHDNYKCAPRRCELKSGRRLVMTLNYVTETQMNTSIHELPSITVLPTDWARQGVTDHNVLYVLAFGLVGAVIGLGVTGFLAAQGGLSPPW